MEHKILWHAIELIAKSNGLTCSGLAKISGLDPTTFNKSKQFTSDGAPRWPSCYTVSKVIRATGMTIHEFANYIQCSMNAYKNTNQNDA